MESENITWPGQGGGKRRYADGCAAAHALELIGQRWALLVLRELLLGPRRFGDLRADLPGISANVLNQRLDELARAGLVTCRRLPPPACVQVYQATPWGLEAEPILLALGRWGARGPHRDPALPISAVALLLSFKALLAEGRAKGIDARIGFSLGRDCFVARLRKGRLKFARGPLDRADATFTAEPAALAAVVYGGAPLDSVAVEGDRAAAARFATLFPLPPKADRGGIEAGQPLA